LLIQRLTIHVARFVQPLYFSSLIAAAPIVSPSRRLLGAPVAHFNARIG
jgi:hypothetical protein